MGFDQNVFINCPFDDKYREILQPLLFTCLYLGFSPRIASERLESGEPRIDKIVQLIVQSRYGVHDLSRLTASKKGEVFRLNMPLELGLDLGCRLFRGRKWLKKRLLILGAEKYRYQAAISDLSNSDIAHHGNEPYEALKALRGWLKPGATGPAKIWREFNLFMAHHYDRLKAEGHSPDDIKKLSTAELILSMRNWVKAL